MPLTGAQALEASSDVNTGVFPMDETEQRELNDIIHHLFFY